MNAIAISIITFIILAILGILIWIFFFKGTGVGSKCKENKDCGDDMFCILEKCAKARNDKGEGCINDLDCSGNLVCRNRKCTAPKEPEDTTEEDTTEEDTPEEDTPEEDTPEDAPESTVPEPAEPNQEPTDSTPEDAPPDSTPSSGSSSGSDSGSDVIVLDPITPESTFAKDFAPPKVDGFPLRTAMSNFSNVPGWVIVGSNFKKMPSGTGVAECANECVRNYPNCKSIDYNMNNKSCSLNNARVGNFRRDNNYQFLYMNTDHELSDGLTTNFKKFPGKNDSYSDGEIPACFDIPERNINLCALGVIDNKNSYKSFTFKPSTGRCCLKRTNNSKNLKDSDDRDYYTFVEGRPSSPRPLFKTVLDGLYQRCSSSNRCVGSGLTCTNGVCKRQVATDCKSNDECASNFCDSNKRCSQPPAPKLNVGYLGSCSTTSQCNRGLTCSSGKCLKSRGSACVRPFECASGTCSNRRCT
tara:strand:+ start:2920 stop:4332 length:1413 start_codon:yes stop_codon:yes gene_type:complete